MFQRGKWRFEDQPFYTSCLHRVQFITKSVCIMNNMHLLTERHHAWPGVQSQIFFHSVVCLWLFSLLSLRVVIHIFASLREEKCNFEICWVGENTKFTTWQNKFVFTPTQLIQNVQHDMSIVLNSKHIQKAVAFSPMMNTF